jgi:hypothetical protein
LIRLTGNEFKNLIVQYPEYILQNRRHILIEKCSIVVKNSNSTQYYLKNLFLRHPTLFLKSLSSFKAKTRFLIVEMGRNLKYETTFPLLLKFNYGQHIKPRCELVFEKFDREFELSEVLKGTDQEFWDKYDIELEDLQEKQNENDYTDEKDILFRYVPVP